MAGGQTPTNDRIVALLQQVLAEMKDLQARQARIESNLERLEKTKR